MPMGHSRGRMEAGVMDQKGGREAGVVYTSDGKINNGLCVNYY